MARTKAISLFESGSTKVDLKDVSGFVIGNIQKETLSSGLKSQAYTGNPAAGSVEFKRFKNSASKVYGTARAAGAGDKLNIPPTTVNLDQHREIVEEAAKFDLDTFGVGNIMTRRADNHVDTVVAELDEAFFQTAVIAGASYEPASGIDTIEKKLEDMIQKLETVKNDYVRGIPRSIMRLVCSPSFYGEIRNYLDKGVNNANVNTAAEEFSVFHNVKTYSSVNLPYGIEVILMIDGAIAQPVVTYPYKDPEKIPLSNDYGVAFFYDYGTKALTPDLIFFYEKGAGTLGTLTVASADAEAAGNTVITVTETALPGRKLVYKTHATTAPAVAYNDVLTTGWTDLPASGELAATNGYKITIAEVDVDDNKAKKAGNATIVVA
ncbi:hypothetical protein SDC9_75303 [bioreactor metagenome]|uniref:Uncharacterized protein n=1 Tax=bioreactor metagenome TaxID=1076179 RepID=A0A644YJM4_9ZZZZ|nr:hypothetical protein [Oscillospiraceae bacterium]